MFSIASIGSCRINTPLRNMAKTYGYQLNRHRNYGYVHTSAEAVQQVKFMLGHASPSQQAWPLIARSHRFDDCQQMPLCHADMYVVEISSLKKLTLGEDCIQLNYLYNEFPEFFADAERRRQYWRLIGNGDSTAISAFLQQQWGSTEQQRQQSQLLQQIRRTLMTDEQILADIQYLQQQLKRVLFVTHVDARKPDGDLIPSRSRLINTVKRLVTEVGGTVYDPTKRMLEVGQANAIEDHSDALAHFTEDFCQILFGDWYQQVIGTTLDRIAVELAPDEFTSKALPHYQALFANNDHQSLKLRLQTQINAGQDHPELYALIAQIDAQNGETAAAIQALQQSLKQHPDHRPSLQSCCELLLSYGDIIAAAAMAERLLESGGQLSCNNLFAIAAALEQLKHPARSATFAIRTLNANSRHRQAANLLQRLAQQDRRCLSDDDPQLIETLIALLPPVQLLQLGIAAVDLADEQQLMAFIQRHNSNDIEEYIGQLNELGEHRQAALITKAYLPNQALSLKSLQVINPRFADWAQTLLQQADAAHSTASKFNHLHHLLLAFPRLREAQAAARLAQKALTSDIRQHYKQGDIDQLEQLHEQLGDGQHAIFELPFLRSRLLFSLGRYSHALSAAEAALTIDSEHQLAQAQRMRSAFRCGQLQTASDAANTILNTNEPDAERLQTEARTTLERIPAKALSAARASNDIKQRYQLLQLASTNSDLAEKFQTLTQRLQRDWISQLVHTEKMQPEQVIEAAMELDSYYPGLPRVQQILGRNLVKRGHFEAALLPWLRLLNLEPDNPDFRFQVNRCRQRGNL